MEVKDGLLFLETNKDSTGCGPESEQVRRVYLIGSPGSKIYHWSEGQAGNGGHSGNRSFFIRPQFGAGGMAAARGRLGLLQLHPQ